MNLKIPAGILDATRLVRGGKLMEATAAIQRALRGTGQPPAPAEGDYDDGETIEGTCRLVDTAPAPVPAPPEPANEDRFTAAAPARPAPTHGRFVTGTYANAAGTRQYKTYIPGVYQGQALPLVVMLHGCTQDPDDFAAGTRMNALADEHGFLVVYPKQASQANVSRCWNWFQATHQHRDVGEPSLIAGITREVVADYGLDSRRVYVAGLSAGGAMAAIMGTTYPDVYAATGVHSGLAYAAASDVPSAFAAMRGGGSQPRHHDASARSVPTIVFHGDVDTTVHPRNGDALIARASAVSSKPSADGNASADVETTVEAGEVNGRAYTRTTYRDAAGRSVMEQWLVHGAAHAWSGGSAQGSYSDPQGPDASREMLRFFLQHQST